MTLDSISNAQKLINPYIRRTPLLESEKLNDWLGSRVIFKADCFQKTGAFKIRGALNAILKLKDAKEIVAFSSGNHAQGVAYAAQLAGIPATIYLPKFVSPLKIQATKSYGATVVITETRQDAERMCAEKVAQGAVLIPPFDHDDIIYGQGTAALEAFQDGAKPDAIFASCGGGGWLSGTYLAAKEFGIQTKVYGAEPEIANDATRSYKLGKIVGFDQTPMSICDGARTLKVAERTFHYLKQLAGFYEISEEDVIYWTQWVCHLLKVTCEPTSALSMAAAYKWLCENGENKTVLIMISGGNISTETYKKIWKKDYLAETPKLVPNLQKASA